MREMKNQRQLEYERSLFNPNALMLSAREKAQELGLLGISLSFSEASLLTLMVQLGKCRKFVEIGTLTGFSSLAIFEGLEAHGKLWTFEKNPLHSQIADEILQQAAKDSGKSVQVITGDAEVQLSSIEGQGPFDGIFIDGNKAAYLKYLNWAEKNVKPGGLIIADNVFLQGTVWGEESEKFNSKQIEVMKEFNKRLSDPEKYLFSLVPTTEGLIIAQKRTS